MSKNYTNYNKPNVQQPVVKSEPEPGVENTPIPVEEQMTPEEVAEVLEPVMKEAEPTLEESKPATLEGVVIAALLNVRKLPNPTAQVLKKINEGTKVTIDQAGSTSDWYKLADGSGYVMKKFITVK